MSSEAMTLAGCPKVTGPIRKLQSLSPQLFFKVTQFEIFFFFFSPKGERESESGEEVLGNQSSLCILYVHLAHMIKEFLPENFFLLFKLRLKNLVVKKGGTEF